MKLTGRKRKVLAVAVTAAAATGLAVGLAGPAAAGPPPAPPGADWIWEGSQCLERQPFPVPGQAYSASGSCIAGSRMVGGRGVDDPIRFENVYGTRYDSYRLSYRPVPVDQAPVGYLDACDPTHVHGWAKDPDWAGSLDVHLYNQNGVVNGFTAAQASEPGTGGTNQRFSAPHGQPSGTVLTVYALGRDAAGGGNGVNPALPHPVGGGTSCVVP